MCQCAPITCQSTGETVAFVSLFTAAYVTSGPLLVQTVGVDVAVVHHVTRHHWNEIDCLKNGNIVTRHALWLPLRTDKRYHIINVF